MDFGEITITDAGGGQRTAELNRATVRIGRAPDNDVVLDEEEVALQHAELLCDPSGCMVFDLSGGKTLLDGAPLAENPQLLARRSMQLPTALTLRCSGLICPLMPSL